ncbi:MAG TPA: cytochrome c oxidase assembly protein [Jatrophihabitans sp.]|nr:cytochrome c oxidase assembly protein [Jatrophihabitans sp.]
MPDSVLPIALVVAAAALYGAGLRVVWRGRSRSVLPAWRVACFLGGLLIVAAALAGPVDGLADDRFSAHMIQHLLLQMLAAPLLALGAPLTVVLLCMSRTARKRVAVPVLRSRSARVLLSPPFAFCAFAGVLWATHYPAIYDAAASNTGLHDLEHLAYLGTAVLLWSVVFGFDLGPRKLDHPARLVLLFCVMGASAVLGLILSTSARPLYPYYVDAASRIGISALRDQHLGGVIMWVSGMVVVAVASVPVLLSWLAEDERRTVRQETRAADNAPTIGG